MNIRSYIECVKSLLFEIIFNNTHLFVSSKEENNGISNKKRFDIEHITNLNQDLTTSIRVDYVDQGGFSILPENNV